MTLMCFIVAVTLVLQCYVLHSLHTVPKIADFMTRLLGYSNSWLLIATGVWSFDTTFLV